MILTTLATFATLATPIAPTVLGATATPTVLGTCHAWPSLAHLPHRPSLLPATPGRPCYLPRLAVLATCHAWPSLLLATPGRPCHTCHAGRPGHLPRRVSRRPSRPGSGGRGALGPRFMIRDRVNLPAPFAGKLTRSRIMPWLADAAWSSGRGPARWARRARRLRFMIRDRVNLPALFVGKLTRSRIMARLSRARPGPMGTAGPVRRARPDAHGGRGLAGAARCARQARSGGRGTARWARRGAAQSGP